MKYFWAILAVALVGIVAIVLLVSSGPQTSKPSSGKLADLSSYEDSDSAAARLIIDGPEAAVEKHRKVRISVSRDTRELAILSGYEGQIIHQQTFDNQDEAFAVFLRALQNADFTKTRTTPFKDERMNEAFARLAGAISTS